MRCLRYGDAALLVETDDVQGLYAGLSAASLDGVTELVPAATTVLVRASYGADLDALTAAVLAVPPVPVCKAEGDELVVPVSYDGEDLADVAGLTGLSAEEVVAAHTGQVWTVAFCGFAPGFGYLTGTDERLTVPRRHTPRTRVPAGSIALAGPYTGVYPRESPGGWQLIGRTSLTVWDLSADPPAVLRPGVRVRFKAT